MVLCGLFENKKDLMHVLEAEDSSADKLSYVGKAAYDILRKKHGWFHRTLWNVTTGKMVGSLQQTPAADVIWKTKGHPSGGHSDWFPEKLKEIMIKTTAWCDLMSLGPPDGVFMTKLQEAIKVIAETSRSSDTPIVVRMMFGNIVGMPVNCDKIIKELTKDLPEDANLHLWVGAWRNGASWNHAKIIAVDGQYLHTGGHNLWDYHYLKKDPVHDLSLEMQGRVAHDGHIYANEQWTYIQKKQSGVIGQCAENIPDSVPLIWKNRVIISEYPKYKASEFAPMYYAGLVPRYEKLEGSVPVISMGRYGAITFKSRPSDDAFIAMIDSAQTIIRMSLQDIGPVCIPKTKIALPGCTWPKPYLDAIARAIWLRGVDVELVLSNPGSIPGDLSLTDACYGNGWSCVDVAAEIIKRIVKNFPDANDEHLRQKVEENLRVCFIRHAKSSTYPGGMTVGNHSKYFIIDDIASYTGSQNLYVCDLAEWGVVVDHEGETKKMMEDYWNPMWEASYTGEDVDVQEVMDGLDIDRDGEVVNQFSADGRQKLEDAAKMGGHFAASASNLYGREGIAAE